MTGSVSAADAADTAPAQPTLSEQIADFQAAPKPYSIAPEDMETMQAASAALAKVMPEPGLKIGEKAPDFELPNAHGKPVRLSNLLKQGPVVLSFYRGAWCPYCNLELKALRDSLPHMEKLGAQLVTVTPQRPDKSLEQVNKDGYPFEILSDLDSSVMKDYRLHFTVPAELSEVYKRALGLDLADFNGPGRYDLPVPGSFVIDRSGVVRAAFANVDYTQRMEPAAIIAALQALATP